MGYTTNGAQIFLQDASGKTRMDYNGTASATWHVLDSFQVDGGITVTGKITTGTIKSSGTANFGGTVSFPNSQFAAPGTVAWGSGSNAPTGAQATPRTWLEIYSNGVFEGFVPCF